MLKGHEIKSKILEGDILIYKGNFYVPSKRKAKQSKKRVSCLLKGMFKDD